MRNISRGTFVRGGLALGVSVLVGGVEFRLLPGTALAATGPTIASCDTWGAAPPTQPVTLTSRPNKILVHHTESANSTDYSQSHAFALARSIQQDHFSRGWIDSGQNFTISRGGYIMEGRHRSLEVLQSGANHVVGAHCPGQNEYAVGIENEGNYMTVQPLQTQFDQLTTLCVYICQQYGISSSQIFGHRDFYDTDCPGDQLYAMLPQLRSAVAARLGGSSTGTRTWPLVQTGSTGENVVTVQFTLRQLGYSLTADGTYNTSTQTAVKQFQTSKGLTSDGVVGRQTWEALLLTCKQGDSGWQVQALQRQLNLRGNYGLTVDGSFGPATDSAVRSFQTAKGLTSDGVAGLNTWCYLTGGSLS